MYSNENTKVSHKLKSVLKQQNIILERILFIMKISLRSLLRMVLKFTFYLHTNLKNKKILKANIILYIINLLLSNDLKIYLQKIIQIIPKLLTSMMLMQIEFH